MTTDAQIASAAKLLPIADIAATLGISADTLIPYGHTKAKINLNKLSVADKKQGKLILVTAINPTPAGEGKTTVTIGLTDAIARLGYKTMAALREPSLGPVFGSKGGAAGGGYAQVVPMEDINLHFTGDFHAIGAANNLLAALIDNHIYQGNELGIERVIWRRAVDMNDRQLRNIESGLGKRTDGVPRADGFDITVASEVMAVFCMASDLADLKARLGKIIIGFRADDTPVYAADLQAHGAMTALLKDAFMPNLVQTLEHTPVLVHGGPFANIAHGCNSVVATKTALKLADFVVTEAGFGADLGAEKFCDIKCRAADITPDACVIVATVRALKYNGGVPKDDLGLPNVTAVKAGLVNLLHHIDKMKNVFGLPVVVALNHFIKDSDDEVNAIVTAVEATGATIAITKVWADGGAGGEALAHAVLKAIDDKDAKATLSYAYDIDAPLTDKIRTLAKRIYGAADIELSDTAKATIDKLTKLGADKLPICMAKTQYSLSDDAKQLGAPTGFTLHIRDVTLSNGAGFVVVICGAIMKMPGLPKLPAANSIDVVDGKIVGLF